MRINGRHSSREATPDKNIASPTPVIVSVNSRHTDSVIRSPERSFTSPDRPVRSPMLYRSTVISPNPERLLYSTFEHPSVILSASRFGTNIKLNSIMQEQPMDFSSTGRDPFDRQGFSQGNEHSPGYAISLAITV